MGWTGFMEMQIELAVLHTIDFHGPNQNFGFCEVNLPAHNWSILFFFLS